MKLFYTFFLLIMLGVSASGQTTVTLTAVKDNTIYSESNTQSNGAGVNLYAGRTGGGARRRALVYFNLESIPAGATITSVSLSLYCNNVAPAPGTAGINLHKLSGDWGEGTSNAGNPGGTGAAAATNDATWANRFFNTLSWTNPGADFSSTLSGTAAISQTGSLSISTTGLVADVESWLANPATNFGWAMVGTAETTNNTARRFASRESTIAAQRPQLTITYTGSLPVTLNKFTATLQKQDALLLWKTSTEINNGYFNIEHSSNGRNFSVVSKVKGAGTSTVENSYSFLHKNIPAGKNYYRLAQYDLNGDVKYSFVTIVNRTSAVSIKVGPNPAATFLILTSDGPVKGWSYVIRSATGLSLQKGVIGNVPLSIASLKPGMYFISVQAPGTAVQTKVFTKQ